MISVIVTATESLMMFQLLRGMWTSENLWKDKNSKPRSGKSASLRQIQKTVLFTDVGMDHKVFIPRIERMLTVPEQ